MNDFDYAWGVISQVIYAFLNNRARIELIAYQAPLFPSDPKAPPMYSSSFGFVVPKKVDTDSLGEIAAAVRSFLDRWESVIPQDRFVFLGHQNVFIDYERRLIEWFFIYSNPLALLLSPKRNICEDVFFPASAGAEH